MGRLTVPVRVHCAGNMAGAIGAAEIYTYKTACDLLGNLINWCLGVLVLGSRLLGVLSYSISDIGSYSRQTTAREMAKTSDLGLDSSQSKAAA